MEGVNDKGTLRAVVFLLTTCFMSSSLLASSAYAAEKMQSDFAPLSSKTSFLRTTRADQRITVAVTLPLRDEKGAEAFVAHVSKLGDPLYRKYLTPAQFATRFGADPKHYAQVVSWAKSRGLTVNEASNISRTVVPITGTARSIGAAFNLRFRDYRATDGKTFFAADSSPAMPQEIRGVVKSVLGLSSANRFAPLAIVLPKGRKNSSGGTGYGGALGPRDIRDFYHIRPQAPTNPTETVAIFEQGGFFQSDVDYFLKSYKLPKVPVVVRNVNGWRGAVSDLGVLVEALLDIDMVASVNPAAKQIVVYEEGDDPFELALLLS